MIDENQLECVVVVDNTYLLVELYLEINKRIYEYKDYCSVDFEDNVKVESTLELVDKPLMNLVDYYHIHVMLVVVNINLVVELKVDGEEEDDDEDSDIAVGQIALVGLVL